MGCICEAFGVSCDADRDFSHSFLILENDEVDVLLLSISTIHDHYVTRRCRENKLANLVP